MRNRAFLRVVLLGLLTFAFVPGLAGAASQGQDLTGTLASSAAERAPGIVIHGPFIGIAPEWYDFGKVNVGGSVSFDFVVSNSGDVGDPDLIIDGIGEDTPGTGFSWVLPGPIPVGGTGLLTVTYTPIGSGPVADGLTVHSNAVNGDFLIVVFGAANSPPAFSGPILDVTIDAYVLYSRTYAATDPDGDALTWSLGSVPPLPLGEFGPTFDTNTGTLDWKPSGANAGDYLVTVEVSDGAASASATFTLTVASTNTPPVADAGGPYSGLVGLGVPMTGAASHDPDVGQSLVSFAWNFGDGNTGTGVTPSHAYAAAGSYVVSLTVTDNGTPALSHTAYTTADIANYLAATIVQRRAAAPVIRTQGNGLQEYGLQMVARPVTDVDVSTLRMSTTATPGAVTEISPASSKRFSIGDINDDLIGDLDMWFRYSDQGNLLSNVANNAPVTIVITARTISDNVVVRGSIDLTKKGSAAVTSAAAPNPFKPETSISYSVERGGPVSIRIFSVGGQLVRSLREENATAGSHEVRWNGRDDAGRTVPSGIYFVSVRQGSESSTTRVVLAR